MENHSLQQFPVSNEHYFFLVGKYFVNAAQRNNYSFRTNLTTTPEKFFFYVILLICTIPDIKKLRSRCCLDK